MLEFLAWLVLALACGALFVIFLRRYSPQGDHRLYDDLDDGPGPAPKPRIAAMAG